MPRSTFCPSPAVLATLRRCCVALQKQPDWLSCRPQGICSLQALQGRLTWFSPRLCSEPPKGTVLLIPSAFTSVICSGVSQVTEQVTGGHDS